MRIILAAVLLCQAQDAPKFPAEKFDKLLKSIKPQAGEFAWHDEILWFTGIQEAREKAAAEGKPILVWCSADGQPCGAT